jgi:sporulation protein YlmC with PRC-barrel domain
LEQSQPPCSPAWQWRKRRHQQRGLKSTQPMLIRPTKGQWRLYKMIGLDVYNQNDEKVGDISELLVDQTGKIQTAILGVGGFLGGGERMVAVNFDQLKFVNQPVELKIASSTRATATPTKNFDIATQTTTGAATTARPSRNTNEQWYPDHAVIDITADQLKAMPRFDYN